MDAELLSNCLSSGEISESEVLANLPGQFTETYGRKMSVAGLLALVDHYGGSSLYIPRTPNPRMRLASILPRDDLLVLCELGGGSRVDTIPSGYRLRRYIRNKRIVAMRIQGLSEQKVAKRFGFSTRWVRVQMARHRDYQSN
jgi:hypothetical protein